MATSQNSNADISVESEKERKLKEKFYQQNPAVSASQSTDNQENLKKDIFVFFSFDLVNSTKFKTQNEFIEKWPLIIVQFYKFIKNYLPECLTGAKLWKLVGDEVLAYCQLTPGSEPLTAIPDIIFKFQEKVEKWFESFGKQEKDNKLRIKSTIWIAAVQKWETDILSTPIPKKLPKQDSVYRNFSFSNSIFYGETEENNGLEIEKTLDFIGPDIDIGFRTAKHAFKEKVALCADLAYIITKLEDPDYQRDKCKIVDFDRLKGVWKQKVYPIIWYYPAWDHVKKSYTFDDYKDFKEIENIEKKNYLSIEDNLLKIYEDLGPNELKRVNTLLDECKKISKSSDEVEVEMK